MSPASVSSAPVSVATVPPAVAVAVAEPPARLRRIPHPEQAVGRVSVGLLLVLGWSAVGHQSGSGWVVALGGVVAATLLLGFLGPLVALVRTSVRVVAAPGDAGAGDPVEIAVGCTRRVRVQGVSPAGGWAFAGAGGTATIEVVPDQRGVLREVALRVGSAAPFGLVWWSREVVAPLPRPLYVAPRLGEPLPAPESDGEAGAAGGRAVAAGAGELRTVREYRHGDSPRRVHWPATAHSSTLMVRETEGGAGAVRVVPADLPADPSRAEERAERLLGTVVALLAAGVRVRLETTEEGGRRVVGYVTDRRVAGRRLASACPWPPVTVRPPVPPDAERAAGR